MTKHSHYDPKTGEINLAPDASLYCKFHEIAHKQQHLARTWPYIFWRVGSCIPGLKYLATLLIEFDALRRARRTMRFLKIWNASHQREASHMFRSYIWRRTT